MTDEQSGRAVSTQALGLFGSQTALHLREGFDRSRHPMLICDDQRRWVSANAAATELLKTSAKDISWRTMDEFTPASGRRRLEEQWQAFLTSGAAEGWFELCIPGRGTVPVEFSAIAHALPSRHLSVFIPPQPGDRGSGEDSLACQRVWRAIPPAGDSAQLTQREREVITLIASGGQSIDMGARLFLSPETIKSHAQKAMIKLGAHTRAHAVAIALVTGQIVWSMYDPAGLQDS